MASTIPYDPSLILGNIVDQNTLDNIAAISTLQAPADAAEQNLNSLISLKRSIDMTIQEMIDMSIDATDLIQKSRNAGQEVQEAAKAFEKAQIAALAGIQELNAKVSEVSRSVQSPIDYNKSAITQMPLATDSMWMNTQYFAMDENAQNSNSHAATVASFVSKSLRMLGEKQSSQASARAQKQISRQVSSDSISGTLVICITWTHKNARVFAPFILDADKAVRAWNVVFADNMINANDVASNAKIEAISEKKDDKFFNVISGATYGSWCVGMVHMLKTGEKTSSQSMKSIATSLQETFDISGWSTSCTVGYGVDASFTDSAKKLLSTREAQSRCSLIKMGVIPSITSNEVKIGERGLANLEPATAITEFAPLQCATASDNNTISSAADAAHTGQKMITLKNESITAALSGLSDIDENANNFVGTNSLIVAMDEYIQKSVADGDNLGVPINYYLKPITQSMIELAWLAKYHPNRFNQAGPSDDGTPTPAPVSAAGG